MSACCGNRASPPPSQKRVRRGDLFFWLLLTSALAVRVRLADAWCFCAPFHRFLPSLLLSFSPATRLDDLAQCFGMRFLDIKSMSLRFSTACRQKTRAREVTGRFTPSVFSGCRETNCLPLLLALEGCGHLVLGFLGSSSLLISSLLNLGKCLGLKAYGQMSERKA